MTSPLTLVMPLKEGVDLVKLAETLETAGPEIDKALSTIGTVHFARFVIFDASQANLRPGRSSGPFKLAVITEYDGHFKAYIQDFVRNIGDVFDALLAFTPDGEALVPVSENVEKFSDYVAENNVSGHPPNSSMSLYCAYDAPVQKILAALTR